MTTAGRPSGSSWWRVRAFGLGNRAGFDAPRLARDRKTWAGLGGCALPRPLRAGCGWCRRRPLSARSFGRSVPLGRRSPHRALRDLAIQAGLGPGNPVACLRLPVRLRDPAAPGTDTRLRAGVRPYHVGGGDDFAALGVQASRRGGCVRGGPRGGDGRTRQPRQPHRALQPALSRPEPCRAVRARPVTASL